MIVQCVGTGQPNRLDIGLKYLDIRGIRLGMLKLHFSVLVLGLCALGTGCRRSSEGLPLVDASLRGEALGTTWEVMWRSTEVERDDVADRIVFVLTSVDQQMSTWRDDSELSRIRASDGPVPVSEATASVLAEALWLAEATGGAFDPTVQPLVELWGFHGAPLTELPSDQALSTARESVDWTRVVLGRSEAGPTIDAGGTALDLSAIAKGHAVDRVSDALSALGIGTHLVSIGGEVRASGSGPDDGLWSVGVEMPTPGNAPGSELYGIVRVANRSVATSGNYRQQRVVEGVEVHHTLDPRTGRPSDSEVASATVIAPTCALADGLATALMVLGSEGLPLIERLPNVEAGLLWMGPNGIYAEESSGFELHTVTERPTSHAHSSE